jgi:hypothetical protein
MESNGWPTFHKAAFPIPNMYGRPVSHIAIKIKIKNKKTPL